MKILHILNRVVSDDSVFYYICSALRYLKLEKTDKCSDDELKKDIGEELYFQLNEDKDQLKLDLEYLNFEKKCFLINNILIKQNYFFWIFELKKTRFDMF